MAVGEARMQANMAELQRRVEERSTKLRAGGKIPD
jgi:D-serine deaminase-like pyridoxal phosphate-dependent protein